MGPVAHATLGGQFVVVDFLGEAEEAHAKREKPDLKAKGSGRKAQGRIFSGSRGRAREAREEEGSAKREICLTNSWNLSRLVILSVKRNHSLLYLSCVPSLVNVKFVSESQKYIFIISLSTMMLCLSVRL